MAVFAAIGFFAFLYPDLNGAVLGVFSFAGAFAAETILLGRYLWHKVQSDETLFDSLSVSKNDSNFSKATKEQFTTIKR
jgi:hypothetical protein